MKKVFMLVLTTSALLLSGCSAVESGLEKSVLEKSGIQESKDYILYEEYKNAGMLDEKGQYVGTSLSEEKPAHQDAPEGKIRVTFGQNTYVDVWYYTDEDMTTPVDSNSCFLAPGETLYAKAIDYHNDNTNHYQLAGFRIAEYGADNHISKEYQANVVDGILKYEIPSDFTGSDICVMPLGEYLDREISMRVFYKDDSGKEHTLGNAGTWLINDEAVDGDSVKINPIDSYALKFSFDQENYFYVGCEPASAPGDPAKTGVVTFWKAEATDDDLEYCVELHRYLKLAISFSEDAKISVNHGDAEVIKNNKSWSTDNLQYGDSITIETSGVCTITDGNYQHIAASKDPIAGGNRYTLKVVQEATDNTAQKLIEIVPVNRLFNVNLDTTCKYGSCTYKLDGAVVSGETSVQEEQELTLTYKITKAKCSFAEKSEGFGGFIKDLVKSKERTVTIPITSDLDGATIKPDELFKIEEKGK